MTPVTTPKTETPDEDSPEHVCQNPECRHAWSDHDQQPPDIQGGQCFECPCSNFLFRPEPADVR